MQLSLIKIGNSRGIRIPSKILENMGFKDNVLVEIVENVGILLKPKNKPKNPREGWEEAFKKFHEEGGDKLLIDDNLDIKDLEELEW